MKHSCIKMNANTRRNYGHLDVDLDVIYQLPMSQIAFVTSWGKKGKLSETAHHLNRLHLILEFTSDYFCSRKD